MRGTGAHGKPGTYTAGCRCDDCREAWRLYNLSNVALRAHRRAAWRAAQWVRKHHLSVWDELLAQAKTELHDEVTP